MIRYTFNPATGEHSFEPSFAVEDYAKLVGRVFGAKDAYLDYSVSKAAQAYDAGAINWVQHVDQQGSRTPVGYHLEYDYRDASPVRQSWGAAVMSSDYEFPAELMKHRTAMIARMKKEKRIKDDSRCPRVAAVAVTEAGPTFTLQVASYHAQVGTNLTLDHPLPDVIRAADRDCITVRDWDRAQAAIAGRGLPSWEGSRLANTIGVGVGFTARGKDGRKYHIYRYRTRNAPVYPNTWHLPVSFALEIDDSIRIGQTHDIADVIMRDLPEELYAEAEMRRRDFHALTPLAFCRDLTRGGKPQFFCELESKLPLDELVQRIGRTSKEYEKRPRVLPVGDEPDIEVSPELACFLALKSGARSA